MINNRAFYFGAVSHAVDDTLCERLIKDVPTNARLVVWEPAVVVAVFSYLPHTKVPDDQATEIAWDLLCEKGHAEHLAPQPDFIL